MTESRQATAETVLRNIVSVLDVNIPDSGLLEGRLTLWGLAGPEHRMSLCVAGNSYEEALLNAIWQALNQAKQTLGLPTTEPDPSLAFVVREASQ